ncbi:MAG: hypothetical protein AB8G22_15145 [Saprospiraceae bacterium]
MLNGSWKGVITQDDGGYRAQYDFELYFNVSGKEITGRSYVTVDDIYCEMKIEGIVENGIVVSIKETKMVDSEQVEGMEWCYKKVVLELEEEQNKFKLTGRWEGITSFSNCVPGEVLLQKIVPRA